MAYSKTVTLCDIESVLINETSCIHPEDVAQLMTVFKKGASTTPGWDKENNLALEKGFSCVPSKSRGYNWCSFSKMDVDVWAVKDGWHRVKEAHPEWGGKRAISLHQTLEDALEERCGVVFKVSSHD